MKVNIRIPVYIEKSEAPKDKSEFRSQAEFIVDSDLFFSDEQLSQYLASSLSSVIASAMMDFEEKTEEKTSTKKTNTPLCRRRG